MIKPYIIRKCECGLWHIFVIINFEEYIVPVKLASYESWWEDVLLVINVPEIDPRISKFINR